MFYVFILLALLVGCFIYGLGMMDRIKSVQAHLARVIIERDIYLARCPDTIHDTCSAPGRSLIASDENGNATSCLTISSDTSDGERCLNNCDGCYGKEAAHDWWTCKSHPGDENLCVPDKRCQPSENVGGTLSTDATCTKKAGTSDPADAMSCAAVTGAALENENACEAVLTAVDNDGDAKACTYAPAEVGVTFEQCVQPNIPELHQKSLVCGDNANCIAREGVAASSRGLHAMKDGSKSSCAENDLDRCLNNCGGCYGINSNGKYFTCKFDELMSDKCIDDVQCNL
tara:strand:+ start:2407 stop:3267 length:861 start_codon:yes stop_codon:yes gene_type:complete